VVKDVALPVRDGVGVDHDAGGGVLETVVGVIS
jgi:hypothetical protein